ncbi:flavodoxin domain-containing protein [Halalkalicoccus salilacus]|uniref:flavodoxin domain-containing protein n=1 Tax=Halalkalicoccus TaxID=332246 RepID=UPI002F967C01
MAFVLVLYGTGEGQTERIAGHVADVIREHGHDVTLLHGDRIPTDLSLTAYDGAVIGASIHLGRHQRYIREFAVENSTLLEAMPSAFFSVSLSAAGRGTQREKARAVLEGFLEEVGWHPEVRAVVPGTLAYGQYGPMKRFVMKLIARRAGGATDTSQNHEYTDWEGVTRFTEAFLERLEG